MRNLMTAGAVSALAAGLALALAPGIASACACGCGVFDVGTASMFPSGSGGTAFLEYDYMDQNRNWSGTSRAPAANNADKEIRTDFYTLGMQYMFSRSWGVEAELPYWNRYFKTTANSGDIVGFTHSAMGDVRLKGLYTGFSPDLSTGISFGVKLPNGDYTYPNFDRDTEIGTGSTDLLLGAYHLGSLTASGSWSYFVQANYEHAVATRDGYRPGDELDTALGTYYNGGAYGAITKVAPVLQIIASYRLHDSGPAADPADSGYQRVLFAPGIQLEFTDVKLYGDVEIPVYQHVNGNQLVAPVLVKFVVSHSF